MVACLLEIPIEYSKQNTHCKFDGFQRWNPNTILLLRLPATADA
jgi:hypothetical protein